MIKVHSTILYTRLFNKLHFELEKKKKKREGIEETYTRRNSLLEHNTHTHMYVC